MTYNAPAEAVAASRRGATPIALGQIDWHKTLLQNADQEVLSADSVDVKLGIVFTTQIVDAARGAASRG